MNNKLFILPEKGKEEKVEFIGVGKFKDGEMQYDAILYLDSNEEYKMMYAPDFIRIAQPYEPLKSAADIAGNMIGTGYTPGYDKSKGEIPAEEVQNVDYQEDYIDDIDTQA